MKRVMRRGARGTAGKIGTRLGASVVGILGQQGGHHLTKQRCTVRLTTQDSKFQKYTGVAMSHGFIYSRTSPRPNIQLLFSVSVAVSVVARHSQQSIRL